MSREAFAPWGNAVCVTCRSVVPDDATCHERVVSLAGDGRTALVDAVWGPDAERIAEARKGHAATARNAAWMGAGATTGVLVSMALMPIGLLTTSLCVLAGSLLGSVAGQVAGKRAGTRLDYPAGAAPAIVPPRFALGRVRNATGLVAPAGGAECAGWAIELRYVGAWGNHVMLRIGATAGIEIAVDGGAVLRIPAGPLRMIHPLYQLDDLETAELELLLRLVDPQRSGAVEAFPPLPFNVVAEDTLHVGERVEIFGVVEPEVVEIGDRLYRDAPATILVPRGIVTVRRP